MLAHVTTPLVGGAVPSAKRRKVAEIAEIAAEISHVEGGRDSTSSVKDVASAAGTPAPAVGVPVAGGFDTDDGEAVYDVNGELKEARRDHAEIVPRSL